MNRERGNIEEQLEIIFKQIKLIESMYGYRYLKDIILECYKTQSYDKNIYTIYYNKIAKQYDTSAVNVEKCIRKVLESTWTKECSKEQYELYGDIISSCKGKPTAARFVVKTIEILTERLQEN